MPAAGQVTATSPSLSVLNVISSGASRYRVPPAMTSTSRSFAGLPSSRKRNFAVSRAYRSFGCCTGASSMPVPPAVASLQWAYRRSRKSPRAAASAPPRASPRSREFQSPFRRRFHASVSACRLLPSAPSPRCPPPRCDTCRPGAAPDRRCCACGSSSTFCGATGCPSGPDTTSASIGIAPWLTENRSSAMAASTATQPPERARTVCDGSNHGLAASLDRGRRATPTSATN